MNLLVANGLPFLGAVEHSDTENGENVRDPLDLRLGLECWQDVPFTSCVLTFRNKEGTSYLSITPALLSVAPEQASCLWPLGGTQKQQPGSILPFP